MFTFYKIPERQPHDTISSVSCGKDQSKVGNRSIQMEEICFPELVIPQGSFAFNFPVCSVWEISMHLAQPLA